VVSFRAHLSIAGFGLAGVYAAVGLVELLALGDWRAAVNFALAAAVTGGLVAALLPLLAPRGGRGPGPEDGRDGPGRGGSGGGGDGPPPPWWPDFEREFWSYLEDSSEPSDDAGAREEAPAGR
jgi:hypothetical protein